MSKEDEVLLEISDRIATITLNAPGRMNTISGVMLDLLSKKLLEADRKLEAIHLLQTELMTRLPKDRSEPSRERVHFLA